MVATASSMEFRLAATSGRKLHARIHDDAAAASNAVGIAVAGAKLQSPIHLDTASVSN